MARQRTFLLLTADVPLSDAVRPAVAHLRTGGHELHLGFLDGTPTDPENFASVHRLTVTAAPGAVSRSLLRVARKVGPRGLGMALASTVDPWFRAAVGSCEEVIALDGVADRALRRAAALAPGVRTVPSAGAAAALADQRAWDVLDAALAAPASAGSEDVRSAFLGRLRVAAQPDACADGVAVAGYLDQLLAGGRLGELVELVALAERLPGLSGDPTLRALRAVGELSATGTTTLDVLAAARGCLAVADDALAAGDVELAADRAVLVLRLLFHRELHSDSVDSPLVADPQRFLAPLHGSRVWQALTAPVTAADRAPVAPEEAGETLRVAVTTGPYGRFYEPVAEALDHSPGVEVRVVDLRTRHPAFRSIAINRDLVRFRLRAGLAGRAVGYRRVTRGVRDVDVVLADWAGKGAVVTSLHQPASSRLVVRVHGVDALNPWLHLVDWSRVEDLVCVGPHLLDLVRAQLGDRLEATRCHVVPNLVDADRFRPVARERPHRTLGMVGWARRVKDPAWTLEVLTELCADGEPWRLRLIGEDFAPGGPASGRAYAEDFRRRADRPEIRDRIDYVGYTRDVPAELAQVDFIVSSSIRESFHLGLLEGVLTGAVPVVRDWPQLARYRAAARLYPAEWVVDTPRAAAARIRAHAEAEAFAAASARAAEVARRRFDPQQVAERYREIVLGR